MVKIPDFAQVGFQPGGMQAYNDAAIRPLDVDAGREAQQMGRAIEQVGRGLGDYASVLLTQARKEQDDLNRTYAVEAFVDYRSKVDKDLYDPQSGYFNKGGRQAFEGERDAVFGRMQQYIADAEKALPNQATKDLFRNRALLFAEERGLQVDLHAGKERKVYQNAVDEQLLQAEQADVPMLWKDADTQTFVRDPNAPKTEFQTRLDAFQKNIRDVGAKRGSAPEVIEANVEAATTAVYAQVVDREADPAKALKLFDQFVADKKIVTQDPQKARTMLQNKVSANVGRDLAAKLWDDYGGDYDLASNALNERRRVGDIDVEAANQGDAQLLLMQRQKATAFASRGLSALQKARGWMDDPAHSKMEMGDMPDDLVTELRDTDTLDAAMAYRANGRMFLNKSATLSDFAKLAASGELGVLTPQELEHRFRSGADDAMWAHIQNVWSQQSGYGTQAQGGGGQSGQRQGGSGNAVPEPISSMLLSRLSSGDDPLITLNDSAKPSDSASVLRYALYEAEFAKRWALLGEVTDPQAAALQIHNQMLGERDTQGARKFSWEVLPDERQTMRFGVTVPGRDKPIAVDAQNITPPETANAVTALAGQGIPVARQTPTMVQQQVVQNRAATEVERARQRAQTNNRWVSWSTVQQELGMTREQVEIAAMNDPGTSPVHPSDFVYLNESADTRFHVRLPWTPEDPNSAVTQFLRNLPLSPFAPNPSDRSYSFEEFAKRDSNERTQHVGISRAAFDRLQQHIESTVGTPTPRMTYGEALDFETRNRGFKVSDTSNPELAQSLRTRYLQAMRAYELEFPELALAASRVQNVMMGPAPEPMRKGPSTPPKGVVDGYNLMRRAVGMKTHDIQFSGN